MRDYATDGRFDLERVRHFGRGGTQFDKAGTGTLCFGARLDKGALRGFDIFLSSAACCMDLARARKTLLRQRQGIGCFDAIRVGLGHIAGCQHRDHLSFRHMVADGHVDGANAASQGGGDLNALLRRQLNAGRERDLARNRTRRNTPDLKLRAQRGVCWDGQYSRAIAVHCRLFRRHRRRS